MAKLRIEVVYALAHAQDLTTVEVGEGATALEAVRASGVLERHPEIDPRRCRFGSFGRAVRADAPLQDGDRIEILRPLAIDPKEARRLRARRRR